MDTGDSSRSDAAEWRRSSPDLTTPLPNHRRVEPDAPSRSRRRLRRGRAVSRSDRNDRAWNRARNFATPYRPRSSLRTGSENIAIRPAVARCWQIGDCSLEETENPTYRLTQRLRAARLGFGSGLKPRMAPARDCHHRRFDPAPRFAERRMSLISFGTAASVRL